MLDKVISNKWDAKMSIQAINDVINIKLKLRTLQSLHEDDDLRGSDVYNRRCATLHRLITGYE